MLSHLQTNLLEQLARARVTLEELFREAGLSAFVSSDDLDDSLDAAQSLATVEAAVKLTGNPNLPLQISDGLEDLADFEAFGFALMSCPNLRTSISLLLRYGSLQFPQRWRSYETDDGLFLRLSFGVVTPYQQQLAKELYLSNLIAVSSVLYSGPKDGVKVYLDYPAPAHHDYYEISLGVPVEFDCEHTQIFIPNAMLDKPVKTADLAEHVVYQRQCEEMLQSLDHAGEVTTTVRNLLIKSVGEFPDIAEIAQNLNKSERTLRRHLETEGTSFRAIVDDVRNLLAHAYLADTPLSVAEIAHLLGYGEAVHFRRAFVRWNKVTPSAFRKLKAAA